MLCLHVICTCNNNNQAKNACSVVIWHMVKKINELLAYMLTTGRGEYWDLEDMRRRNVTMAAARVTKARPAIPRGLLRREEEVFWDSEEILA
mmetsp:Transcript_27354/g.43041  ORF Transcript_27354/g.43041 Transcript_27354/m.43041 type:complete len:92 (+) Transcript_27354:87-362(+)